MNRLPELGCQLLRGAQTVAVADRGGPNGDQVAR